MFSRPVQHQGTASMPNREARSLHDPCVHVHHFHRIFHEVGVHHRRRRSAHACSLNKGAGGAHLSIRWAKAIAKNRLVSKEDPRIDILGVMRERERAPTSNLFTVAHPWRRLSCRPCLGRPRCSQCTPGSAGVMLRNERQVAR